LVFVNLHEDFLDDRWEGARKGGSQGIRLQRTARNCIMVQCTIALQEMMQLNRNKDAQGLH